MYISHENSKGLVHFELGRVGYTDVNMEETGNGGMVPVKPLLLKFLHSISKYLATYSPLHHDQFKQQKELRVIQFL